MGIFICPFVRRTSINHINQIIFAEPFLLRRKHLDIINKSNANKNIINIESCLIPSLGSFRKEIYKLLFNGVKGQTQNKLL